MLTRYYFSRFFSMLSQFSSLLTEGFFIAWILASNTVLTTVAENLCIFSYVRNISPTVPEVSSPRGGLVRDICTPATIPIKGNLLCNANSHPYLLPLLKP